MQKATIAFWQCQKGDREDMRTETQGCVVYWIYTSMVTPKPPQISLNRKSAPLQRLACVSITGSMHFIPTAAPKVILVLPPLGIYIEDIEGEARQAIYRLNCTGEFTKQDLVIQMLSKR
jgi:hypothetical protein